MKGAGGETSNVAAGSRLDAAHRFDAATDLAGHGGGGAVAGIIEDEDFGHAPGTFKEAEWPACGIRPR